MRGERMGGLGRRRPSRAASGLLGLLVVGIAACGQESGGAGPGGGSGAEEPRTCSVIAPPAGYDEIYVRYLNCNGVAIVATAGVDDAALLVANETMDFMMKGNDTWQERVAATDHYYALFGGGLTVSDLPGFEDVPLGFSGYSGERATTTSGVELLCKMDEIAGNETTYFEANFFVHEFAHLIHYDGIRLGSARDGEIRAAYEEARSQGLWDQTYAGQDDLEYFAELTTLWFEVGRRKGEPQGDGIRNHVTTREELRSYDPRGYELMRSTYHAGFDVPGCIQRGEIHPYLDPDLSCPAAVSDADGTSYAVVRIGNQCWMAANLATTRLQDGQLLPEVADAAAWAAVTTPSYANFDNDEANVPATGRLYNHAAATSPAGICPAGMRIPSHEDILKLVHNIDPRVEKERSALLWVVGATSEAADTFGFGATPSGWRESGGAFLERTATAPGDRVRWSMWTTDDDPSDPSKGSSYTLLGPGELFPLFDDKRAGLSVRCLLSAG